MSRRKKVGRTRRLWQILYVMLKRTSYYHWHKWRLLPTARNTFFATQLRQALEELGPTFVKIGQLVSVRADIFSPEVIQELEKLQDAVPPLPPTVVRNQIETELGRKLEDLFAFFETKSLASASIGQVHRAVTHEGIEVAVKVQRPGIRKIIDSDLDLFEFIARFLHATTRVFRYLDPVAAHEEFTQSLHRELDYTIEGRHAERFRFNFRNDPRVKIPYVLWQLTSKKVLTMEFIHGTKISDIEGARNKGVDYHALAKYGAEAFMKQVLSLGFFHGDLHPSNLFITNDGKIGYLDFGIVGNIKPQKKRNITLILLGMLREDVELIITEAAKLGVEIPSKKLPELKEDFKQILQRYRGQSLQQMKIDIIGREFLGLIYKYHLHFPRDYALLAKALITVEGVAKTLYPDFDILEIAAPYVQRLVIESYPPILLLGELYTGSRVLLHYLFNPSLPTGLLKNTLSERGGVTM